MICRKRQITDADRIMFNPSYLKKLEKEIEDEENRASVEVERAEISRQANDPLRNVDNQAVKELIQAVSDPRNSDESKERQFRGHAVDMDSPDERDPGKPGNVNIFVKLFQWAF